MQPTHALRLVSLLFSLTSTHSFGQKSLADLLAEPGADLSDPVSRAQIVGQLKKTSAERRANARTKASAKGLPLRITRPNGAFQEIIDFEGSIPIYFTTTNTNAAIATGASPGRTTHSLDGSGGGPFVIAATDSTFSGTSSITGHTSDSHHHPWRSHTSLE